MPLDYEVFKPSKTVAMSHREVTLGCNIVVVPVDRCWVHRSVRQERNCIVVPIYGQTMGRVVLDRQRVAVVIDRYVIQHTLLLPLSPLSDLWLGVEVLLMSWWLRLTLVLPLVILWLILSLLLLLCNVLRHWDHLVEVRHIGHKLLHVANVAKCVGYNRI